MRSMNFAILRWNWRLTIPDRFVLSMIVQQWSLLYAFLKPFGEESSVFTITGLGI
jgi:hypothetical protein